MFQNYDDVLTTEEACEVNIPPKIAHVDRMN